MRANHLDAELKQNSLKNLPITQILESSEMKLIEQPMFCVDIEELTKCTAGGAGSSCGAAGEC
jgi:hypothetical protein